MDAITIRKHITHGEKLVVLPREEHEEFLHLRQTTKNKDAGESDTDAAIKIYQEEKKKGKLETLNSLVDLD
jgi:hypothetical protein